MTTQTDELMSKVPEVTLVFWIIKILATTLGETGGDALSMSMNLGYLVATGVFAVIFLAAVVAQIHAKRFTPALYWTTIIATTTVGTTLADFADRSLGIGYAGGATLLFALLLASLALWYRTTGSVAVVEPPQPIQDQIALYESVLQAPTSEERIATMKQVLQTAADNFWVIGISSATDSYRPLSAKLANVPESWVNGWNPGGVAIAFPEQWYFQS